MAVDKTAPDCQDVAAGATPPKPSSPSKLCKEKCPAFQTKAINVNNSEVTLRVTAMPKGLYISFGSSPTQTVAAAIPRRFSPEQLSKAPPEERTACSVIVGESDPNLELLAKSVALRKSMPVFVALEDTLLQTPDALAELDRELRLCL